MFFTKDSILSSLQRGEFADLPISTQRKLTGLMARIAEDAYRRGFQHGSLGFFKQGNIADWRFGPLDHSPHALHKRTIAVEDQFQVEYGYRLAEIGILSERKFKR